MSSTTIVLTIPALREQDLSRMPRLSELFRSGASARIEHSFPAVTWPSQATVLTGKPPSAHGVVANGFFWRETGEIEMWTAWNEVIQAPQVWDVIKQRRSDLTTAAWFPMLSKGCGADYICMPAPIHQPDGSEELWCHTRPQDFYGELLEQLGHFPLHHFWGPLANIRSTEWIVGSAAITMQKFQPNFWYIYLPHLDYAAQKCGPDSPEAERALGELDTQIGNLAEAAGAVYSSIRWLAISEYVITDVDHVTFPNRVLREAGLLQTKLNDDREYLDLERTQAWAMVDHQFSHVFVRDRDQATIQHVVDCFEQESGIAKVLSGSQRDYVDMDHPRSGDVILISEARSWQAYYWWDDDRLAPEFARSVDIHRKPGYDPVELFVEPQTRSIPLDASLVRGSHGVPAVTAKQQGVALCSLAEPLNSPGVRDRDLFDIMLQLALDS